MAEPPYGGIWQQWKAGRVVPFLGAGASLVGRTFSQDEEWNPDNPTFLPSGAELAQFVAREASFPSQEKHDRCDLAKVCSYYADYVGRKPLRELLRHRVFIPETQSGNTPSYRFGPLHELLANVPGNQVIVVTNYDTLLEQAFLEAGKPYDLVVYPADRTDLAQAVLWWKHGDKEPRESPANKLDINLDKTTVIFKMHGTILPQTPNWDNLVITEEDYVEFLLRMTTNAAVPSRFLHFFHGRSFLFLGYSLRDWNLRVILKNLSKCFVNKPKAVNADTIPSWAIQVAVSELDEKLWAKRNVDIYECNLDTFARRMWEVSKLPRTSSK